MQNIATKYHILLFLSLITIFLLIKCDNNVEVKKKKPLVADAGPDQTIPACSYVIIDASKSYLGENPGRNPLYEWTQDPGNPEKVAEIWTGDNKTHLVSFVKEGVYKFTLVVSSAEGRSEPDEVIITVTPRLKSVIVDPRLEISARYYLKNQHNVIKEEDLLKLDTLAANMVGFTAPKVSSLEGLQYCKNLKVLELNLQDITDVTPLRNLKQLKRLGINQNYNLEDISPLAGLTNLEYLNLDTDLSIEDISVLKNLTKLRFFNIMYDTLITDVSVIENFKQLEDLELSNQKLNNIDFVSNLTKLKALWISACNINDIKPISNLIDLDFLHMKDNKIEDITPLKNLKKLVRLYLSRNKIKDISVLEFLPNLNKIILDENKIEDISPLVKNEGIGMGDFVSLVKNPLNEKSINKYIPELQQRGVTVYW